MTTAAGDAAPVSALGTLADGVVGRGGRAGAVGFDRAGIEIDWWIGADDGWTDPAGVDVHTIRPGVAPAIEAHRRVPSGESVMRAYAVTEAGAPLVVAEIENASPAPFVVAWIVRAAPGYRIGRVAIEGSTLVIDERAWVHLPGVPSRWAVAPRREGVHDAVVGGRAASGQFDPVVTRRGDLEVAVLFPVAHRARTRIAARVAEIGNGPSSVAVGRLPALVDVERGWDAALDRGLQLELPEEAMQAALDAARTTVMLGAVGAGRRDRVVAAAARAWGLADAPVRARPTRTRFRPDAPNTGDPWPSVRAAQADSGSSPRHAARWIEAVRAAIVQVGDDEIDFLPRFPVEWLGLPVAAHEVQSPNGPLSFALRWHGVRPALLWDVPAGLHVRASGLDPAWRGAGGSGEALLAEIDAEQLLSLGSAVVAPRPSPPGVTVDEPGSFT